MSKIKNAVEDMILKIFAEQSDCRPLTFTEIRDNINCEMRKTMPDFTIHDQQLVRISRAMLVRGSLKKTETGYILPTKRSKEDLDMIKRDIESDNYQIFSLVQFGGDIEYVHEQSHEYIMNLLERQKKLNYRLLCDEESEPKIREILRLIEETIKGIHTLLKDREKKLSDRLEVAVNYSLNKEYYNKPYSCNPLSDSTINQHSYFPSSSCY